MSFPTRRDVLVAGSLLGVGFAGCSRDRDGDIRPGNESAGPPAVGVDRCRPDTAQPTEERLVHEWERSDVPPYPIPFRPIAVDTQDDWNPDFLGEHLPADPSLPVDILAQSTDWEVPLWDPTSHGSYIARLIRTPAQRKRLIEIGSFDGAQTNRIRGVDLSESVIVLVGDCCGSSSVEHRWGRIESNPSGLHLHGYEWRPFVRLQDLTTRYSVLAIGRPAAEVKYACISYTDARWNRVHFDTTERTVALADGAVYSEYDAPVTLELRVTTADGAVRIDDRLTLEPGEVRTRIGDVAVVGAELHVDAELSNRDVAISEAYTIDDVGLGVAVRSDGTLGVGRPGDI